METYSERVVLITGSRRGVGAMIRDHFLRLDATVIGLARGEATIDHPRHLHFQVDLADSQAITATFSSIRRSVSRIDIVINNAAVLTSQYALILPSAAAQAMVNVNLIAPFLVSRESAKLMRKAKWGRIVNIGSMAASLEPVGDSIYAATKAGLAKLANVMAREFGPYNITCNTVAISAIETGMLEQLPREKIDAIIATLPIARLAKPEDILNVIDFFASERSDYITAQTIYLGGVN